MEPTTSGDDGHRNPAPIGRPKPRPTAPPEPGEELTAMTYRVHLKTESADLELREVLQSSPGVLLRVSDAAKNVLTGASIETVYDLALATPFGDATRVFEAASDATSVLAQHGGPPSDLVVLPAPTVLNTAATHPTADSDRGENVAAARRLIAELLCSTSWQNVLGHVARLDAPALHAACDTVLAGTVTGRAKP
jgi:hypothetical protein